MIEREFYDRGDNLDRISEDGNVHDAERLKELQALSLDRKIGITQARIMEFYREFNGQVYVSFSGGKDSTVLLDICRKLFPEIEAVFVDTGLEYPEIRQFVKTYDNVTWLRPEMNFKKVIEQYGYPIISKDVSFRIGNAQKNKCWALRDICGKNIDGTDSKFKQRYKKYAYLKDAPFKIGDKCCSIMKKSPCKKFEKQSGKKPIIGTLTIEGGQRKNAWIKTGCNLFDSVRPQSKPMSFWTEQDVLQYIKFNSIKICEVYGKIVENNGVLKLNGEQRTGCVFCGFGANNEKQPNRFQRLAESHPKIYEYCMKDWEDGGLGLAKVLDYIGVKY